MSAAGLLSINFQHWFLQIAAMMATGLLIPRLKVKGPLGAFLMVGALAYINAQYWDAALFYQIPDTFNLPTILLFLINGLIFWVLVKLLPWIEVKGFLPAFIAPIIFTICTLLIHRYGDSIDWMAILSYLGQLLVTLKEMFLNSQSGTTVTEGVTYLLGNGIIQG